MAEGTAALLLFGREGRLIFFNSKFTPPCIVVGPVQPLEVGPGSLALCLLFVFSLFFILEIIIVILSQIRLGFSAAKMSDLRNRYSDDVEVEVEDNPIDKKLKNAVSYYVVAPFVNCKCCQELEKRVPAAIDVNEHLSTAELKEFEDVDARVRLAHYWKKLRESGAFNVDCPPFVGGRRAGIYFNGEHFARSTKMKFMRDEAMQCGIQEYSKATGKQMKLKKIDKLTVSQGGCHKIFFVTFIGIIVENGTTSDLTVESSDPVDKEAASNEDFYETVVTYDTLDKTSDVLVFRRKSDGKDLLEPRCPMFAELTRYPNRKACSGTIPDAVTEGLEK